MKGDGAVAALGNQLGDLVAVALFLFEQGEDQEFGTATLELSLKGCCTHIWAQQISLNY